MNDCNEYPAVDPELDAELDRRLAAHDADPGNVRTWEQIEARLQAGRRVVDKDASETC